MINYNLVLTAKDKTKYAFNPKDVTFTILDKSVEVDGVELSVLDKLTSSFSDYNALAKSFGIDKEIINAEIVTSVKKKKLAPIFNDPEWLKVVKETNGMNVSSGQADVNKTMDELLFSIKDYMPGMVDLLSDQKYSFGTEDVVNRLLVSLYELDNNIKSADKDDEILMHSLTQERVAIVSSFSRLIHRYDALRYLYVKRKEYNDYIDKLQEDFIKYEEEAIKQDVKELKNDRSSRYSLIVTDSNDNKYYYVQEFQMFIHEKNFKADFVPKSNLTSLDSMTSGLSDLSMIKGFPEDAKDAYISYMYKGEIRIPVITNDPNWSYFVNDRKARNTLEDRKLRSMTLDPFAELSNFNFGFNDMLITDKYEKGSGITDRLKNTIIYLTTFMNKRSRMGDANIQRFANAEEIQFAKQQYISLMMEYNEFRTMYLNHKFFKENGLVEKSKTSKEKNN